MQADKHMGESASIVGALTQILEDCRAYGAKLIAVSKAQPEGKIDQLWALGQRRFGENYLQEAQSHWQKKRAIHSDLELHMVGHLQSNKALEAVQLFDFLHSVDRLNVVDALARAQDKTGRRPQCFLQVNTGDEAQKSGVSVADLPQLYAYAQNKIVVTGLMCIPPASGDPAPHFKLLQSLADQLGLSQLSMGMSADYKIALACGATHIRVGSRLFGARVQDTVF